MFFFFFPDGSPCPPFIPPLRATICKRQISPTYTCQTIEAQGCLVSGLTVAEEPALKPRSARLESLAANSLQTVAIVVQHICLSRVTGKNKLQLQDGRNLGSFKECYPFKKNCHWEKQTNKKLSLPCQQKKRKKIMSSVIFHN